MPSSRTSDRYWYPRSNTLTAGAGGVNPASTGDSGPGVKDHDVELDLDPGQEVVPRLGQRTKDPPQQPAPVQRHRLPVAEVHVAQHPPGAIRPRQDPERGRIGHQHHVREPGELLDAEPAAPRERGHEHLVAGVQAVDRAGEVEPVGHGRDGRLRGQHLAPRHAVLVDHGQPDRPQPQRTDRAITSCARASRSGEASPCRPTNPGCPTPEGSMLTRVNNAATV